MTTVLPEFVASQNGALSSAGENSTAATNSCCVPPPPVLRQSYSAPQSNQDLQHTQFSATLCNEQGTGDRRFNGRCSWPFCSSRSTNEKVFKVFPQSFAAKVRSAQNLITQVNFDLPGSDFNFLVNCFIPS